jgi:hypothetical protein
MDTEDEHTKIWAHDAGRGGTRYHVLVFCDRMYTSRYCILKVNIGYFCFLAGGRIVCEKPKKTATKVAMSA